MGWKLQIRRGPQDGALVPFGEAPLVIGRDPGDDGHRLDGDPTVSRRHFEVRADGSGAVLRNHSANGTEVNGEIVDGSCRLSAGDLIRVGDLHVLEVTAPAASRRPPAPAPAAEAPTPAPAPKPAAARRSPPRSPAAKKKAEAEAEENKGLLQRPAVLAMLLVYLIGAGGLWLWIDSSGDAASGPDWRSHRAAYLQRYAPEDLSPEERAERVGRADELVTELEVALARGRPGSARQACLELMAIDRDSASPIYTYGARHLARLPAQ